MSDHNQHTIKELLEKLIQQYRLKPKLHEADLREHWPKIMGNLINNYTKDISVRKDKVYLTLTSSALKNELTSSKPQLIRRLNQHLGEDFIKDIIIK